MSATRRIALPAWIALIVALGALVGWLSYGQHQRQVAEADRNLFVQVARQGALNLTTISYTEADQDVQRILDASTGAFHDDFQKRSAPFIKVLQQVHSTSTGTVTEAGLQSQDGDHAQVLVATSVKVTGAGASEQPRFWRMRVTVQKIGADAKVSNVEFVP
ncbi:Mce-associated membrane protein [Mycobacterium sp. MAA66]|jgi:Mce-associated membrane protein|uniref:mammalian cell entry protein n=1 Tax=Mycobacterium sp. MAA66 TaxID=3156297 RepID=UPI00351523D8